MNRAPGQHINNLAGQQPPNSPSSDSDYCSSFEEDFAEEENNPETAHQTISDDWIELDLSADSAQSLSFLSDSDFQAVLKSFAEFTSHQFGSAVINLREIQGVLCNHLAYLLWRRAVLSELGRLPPVHMEPSQLDELLDGKWRENSVMMQYNRQRFRLLADATAVPQLVLATFKTCFRKRQADKFPSGKVHKRNRQN